MATKKLKHRSIKAGLPPGTLVHIGDEPPEQASATLTRYTPEFLEEGKPVVMDHLTPMIESGIFWLNVRGIQDTEAIRHIGSLHDLHPLVLEDIVNTSQRPKIEDYGQYLFIVMKMLRLADEKVTTEQISFILGEHRVISFQEGHSEDVFKPVMVRLRAAKGRIRNMGPDYLLYALIDTVVDNYFVVLEEFGEAIELLEEDLATSPSRSILVRINQMKRDMIFMRKAVWPLREVTYSLERGDSGLIADTSKVFFRDVYDHTIQIMDAVETNRDLITGMLDLYLSSMSNRTNEVMKFLTVIGTIFMPLTFLVGVYGMNFKYLPELEWRYSYFVLWIFMISLTLVMVFYFRRKKWF